MSVSKNTFRPAMMTRGMKLLERLLTLCLPAPRQRAPSRPAPRPRKLLAMKLSGMGDAVMVRSLLEHMRELDSKLEIGVLGGPSTIEALSCNSTYQAFCYRPKQVFLHVLTLLWRIRKSNYDTLIDFEPYSLLTAAFGAATGIPNRLGFAGLDGNPRAAFFSCAQPIDDRSLFWTNYAKLARLAAPALPDGISPRALPISDSDESWIANWLDRNVAPETNSLIAIHLGVAPGMEYRCWPLNRFAECAVSLGAAMRGLAIVLTGTPPEGELARRFIELFPGAAIDATNLGSISRTAYLLSKCVLLISGDTGVMHLGAAMGTPTIGLFGASNPEHWAPTGSKAVALYHTVVACSPCANVYHRITPRECTNQDRQRCMLDLSSAAVVAKGLSLIGEKRAHNLSLDPQCAGLR